MSVYFFGDTHGNFQYLNRFIKENCSKDDIIIICGDFGYWRKSKFKAGLGYFFDDIDTMGTKIYRCDGNHEDHAELKYLVNEHGWKNPIQIAENIFYCPRGSSMELPNKKKILFFGGGRSTDRANRLVYFDYFPEEIPTYQEFMRLNPDEHYDIVVSHTCPENCLRRMEFNIGVMHDVTDYTCTTLSVIFKMYKPTEWFFGHWHVSDSFEIDGCKMTALNKTPDKGCYVKYA